MFRIDHLKFMLQNACFTRFPNAALSDSITRKSCEGNSTLYSFLSISLRAVLRNSLYGSFGALYCRFLRSTSLLAVPSGICAGRRALIINCYAKFGVFISIYLFLGAIQNSSSKEQLIKSLVISNQLLS